MTCEIIKIEINMANDSRICQKWTDLQKKLEIPKNVTSEIIVIENKQV